ncbi:MAG: transposase [Magnetococcus sp. WYHC-3]
MARHVRIRVCGGWYHVFSRGHNREQIFTERADYVHFLELVEIMRERFRVHVYAYCLMSNHYHLLLSTPEGNISQAIQWLNGSYGIWHNRKHNRTGHLYGERFHAILVEDSAWGLDVSVYIHMNPVATTEFGYGKRKNVAERRGLAPPPTPEERVRRLNGLREYEWSSYRAYAGYCACPQWLDRAVLLRRAGVAGEKSYRDLMEDRILQGEDAGFPAKVRWGLVLGAERFARKVRGRIQVKREYGNREALRKRCDFEKIVMCVEKIKNEKWDEFRDRYGDWGRDLVLWAGRQYGGLSLRELGRLTSSDYSAVAMGVRRLADRARRDRALRSAMKRVAKQCS